MRAPRTPSIDKWLLYLESLPAERTITVREMLNILRAIHNELSDVNDKAAEASHAASRDRYY